MFANERQLNNYTAKQKLVWATTRTSVDHDVNKCVRILQHKCTGLTGTVPSAVILSPKHGLTPLSITVILIAQIRQQLSLTTGRL